MAGVAFVVTGNTDFAVFAGGGFFERDLHGVAQVVAAKHLPAAALLASGLTEDVAEDIAKAFAESAKARACAARAAHIRVDTGVS